MKELKFLNKIDENSLKIDNKMYRGLIPWNLMYSKEKKIIYISTSNRNLENYYAMVDSYLTELSNGTQELNHKIRKNIEQKSVSMFENISSKKEDLTGINIELLDILKNKSDFILFLNLQITLDIFFERVNYFDFKVGNDYKYLEVIEFLQENGYEQSYLLGKKGEYSKRGDILDIFPPNAENPIRLEFFDTELESIREFDIDTQKSITKLNEIKIFGNALLGNNYEFVELIEELKSEDVTIILENEELLNYKIEEYVLIDREKENTYRQRYENLKRKSHIIETVNFKEEQMETFRDKEKLKKLSVQKDVQIYTKNYDKKVLEYNKNLKEKQMSIVQYELFEGFVIDGTFVLTDRELDGYIYQKKRKSNKGIKYKQVNQILVGDYVIHIQYGVGLYQGIETIEEKDYLKVKYADEDVLYIPVEKLDRLEKFVSYGEEPKLYKLGTRGFKRRKKKLEEDLIEFAGELIKIQAERQAQNGFVYGKDTIWQEEFEAEFPFEETEDQKKAIQDVKNDMESPHIMDRIVCGDVGYGKTEVSMRAAFKAIENGKQVVMIAPTTVLAEQHYMRFKRRFEKYPITIERFSRLTQSKSKEILKNLKSGMIDLIIGTHRLLSKDVEFNNLGLLIIDEEQKFGVKAKETIKQKRSKVDVLTLTATPIPRTLNLALLGIREISIIDTPPINRLPIITEVVEWNENIVKMSILRELSRDGQVFYIYNDVKNMKYKLKELKELLPEFVKIEFIHGQLPPKEIKDKLKRFEEGEYDVLMASTIIENGIDVSNANTILIENFAELGLSQLYQLRGRVGRSNRQGYCYLLKTRGLTTKGKLKEESIHKVEGIKSGGFQISMEDMKIRGAGEILGDKQHGTIETFGYDLYIKMLNEEIKRQKGEYKEKLENVEIILKEKGYIPETYIEKEERLNVYKRFAMLESYKELDELVKEIKDRFGKIPEIMKKFILSVKFKIFAEQNKIQKIEEKNATFELHFVEEMGMKYVRLLSKNLEMRNITKNKIFAEQLEKKEEFIVMEVVKMELFDYVSML